MRTTGLRTTSIQLVTYRRILQEYMTQLISYYKARCLIVSGLTSRGAHWQTFDASGNLLKIYNGRPHWIPEMLLGVGPGIVAIKGPKIQ